MFLQGRAWFSAGLAGLLASFLLPAPALAAKDKTDPLSKWWRGPVRYIMSREEIDIFKGLTDDRNRRRFIQQFWRIRDPDLTTDLNEYREVYRERVAFANSMFHDSTKPGWMTDRGRIYILLGPPNERKETPFALGQQSVLEWTYQSSSSPYLTRNTVVRFVEDRSGEYRLTQGTMGDLLDKANALPRDGFSFQELQPSGITPRIDLMELQKIYRPPGEALEEFDPGAIIDRTAFRVHPGFYLAEDGNTLVTLTVGIRGTLLTNVLRGKGPHAPRVDLIGLLVREDGRSYRVSGDRGFRPSPDNDSLGREDLYLYQGAVTVLPGSYTVHFGVQDWNSGELLTFRHAFRVPNFLARAFALSSITLTRGLERVERASTPEELVPFVLGNLKVQPLPEEFFRTGEELAFYYQIYHAERDPESRRTDLNATYQFLQRPFGSSDVPYQPVGSPLVLRHLKEAVQGYSLSLRQWPPGEYRLQVKVRDNLSGEQAEEDVFFQIR